MLSRIIQCAGPKCCFLFTTQLSQFWNKSCHSTQDLWQNQLLGELFIFLKVLYMKPFRSNYIKVLLLPISQEIEYGEPRNINFLKKKKTSVFFHF